MGPNKTQNFCTAKETINKMKKIKCKDNPQNRRKYLQMMQPARD